MTTSPQSVAATRHYRVDAAGDFDHGPLVVLEGNPAAHSEEVTRRLDSMSVYAGPSHVGVDSVSWEFRGQDMPTVAVLLALHGYRRAGP